MKHAVHLLLVVLSLSVSSGISQQLPSADFYFEKGRSFAQRKNAGKAYEYFFKAMDQARSDKNLTLYVKSINEMCTVSDDLDDNVQSELFDLLKRSFSLLKVYPRNSDLAQLHYNTADFYNNLTYEGDTAIFHYTSALKIWLAVGGEENGLVAACYHGMGDIYKFVKNDFLEAELCYEKALQIRERIHFKDERELTRNYYGLATTNRSQHDFEKALSYGIRTLELSEKLNNLIYQEMTSYIVANIYRDMHRSAKAREYYLKAIELNRHRNEPQELAYYYMGLGETLRNDSLPEEALFYFDKALRFSKADKLQIVYLRNLMGETYLMKGDLFRSMEMFRRESGELSALNMLNSRQAYYCYSGIGDCYFLMNQNDSALHYYQKAIQSVVESFSGENNVNPAESMVGSDYYIHGVLNKKARVLGRLYSLTKDPGFLRRSMECLQLAEKLLSLERNTLDMEDSKWIFLQNNYDVYEEIIAATFELSKVSPQDSLLQFAFQYFEKSKARSLSDALIRAEQANEIKSNDSLLRSHQVLKRELFSVQDKLNSEIEKNRDGTLLTGKLREQVVLLDRKLQASKSIMEESYPGYFKIKYGDFIPALKDIQASLRSENKVVLDYFFGNMSVYAIGISSEEVVFKRLGSADSVRAMASHLMSHFVEESPSTNVNAYKDFTSNSHFLYNTLVNPFKTLIKENKRLLIIPDGLISQLPFEILLEKEHAAKNIDYRSLNYLVKTHSVGYAFSLAMLMHSPVRTVEAPSLLAMGFTNGNMLRAPDPQLTELEGSEKELKVLEGRFAGGKFLEGGDATEHNFKLLSPGYDIIHLAIHGKGDVERKYAASLFFRPKYDSVEDGELHAYELYGLKLRALLTVLSSCESGLGKDYRGEGMSSMASAFAYSGSENILMSLWKVNDQASIELMDDFYSRILEGDRIDDALAEAKLKYLDNADELTSDPKVWAPLVGYGKLNPIFERRNRTTTYFIVGSAILATLLLLMYFKKRRATIWGVFSRH